MPTPSLAQLQRALLIAEKIQELEDELKAVMEGIPEPAANHIGNGAPSGRSGGRKMSGAIKTKMRASQAARWAKRKDPSSYELAVERLSSTAPGKTGKKKRVLSPEGRARIVAALKARHAAKMKKVTS